MAWWTSRWMDDMPIFVPFLASVLILMLACEVGHQFGGWVRRSTGKTPSSSLAGGSLGSVLGLLALILAFTFGMAEDRYGARKALVLEEANAVGTAWLRADLLHEPHRSECKRLLHEYVDVRLEAVRSGDVEQLAAAAQHSAEIHQRLWAHVTEAAHDKRDSVMIGLMVASLNDVIDLHSKRISAALRNRIPEAIWSTLYWVACVCTGLLGFLGGTQNQRSLLVGLALMVTFSFVMVLIMDLDRPQQHAFTVNQAALEDLAAQMTVAER